jgi:hypothetical protein
MEMVQRVSIIPFYVDTKVQFQQSLVTSVADNNRDTKTTTFNRTNRFLF